MSDWHIERVTETPDGLRVDFHNERTTQRVSGFFNRWAEPPHLGTPFTHAAQAKKSDVVGDPADFPDLPPGEVFPF